MPQFEENDHGLKSVGRARFHQRWGLPLLMLLGAALSTGCSSLQSRDNAALDSAAAGVSEEESNALFNLGAASPTKIRERVKLISGQGPDQKIAKQRFAEAEQLYTRAAQQRRSPNGAGEVHSLFEAAAEKYEKAALRWPKSSLEQDALFMAAECYFFRDEYPKANENYEKLIGRYPNTRHMDVAQQRRYAVATYWLESYWNKPTAFYHYNFADSTLPKRDWFGEAVRVLDKMRYEDPTGDHADDATLAAADAYFRKGDYFRADQLYMDLRSNFPASDHQFAAHLRGLKAKLATYPGPDYPSNTLVEAEKIVKQLYRQFRPELERNREEVDGLAKTVRYKQAEYDFQMAQYFDLRHQYASAKHYYQDLIQKYNDTPFAVKAEERIASISGQPDTPPQRLSWLVNLFPEADKAKPLLIDPDSATIRR